MEPGDAGALRVRKYVCHPVARLRRDPGGCDARLLPHAARLRYARWLVRVLGAIVCFWFAMCITVLPGPAFVFWYTRILLLGVSVGAAAADGARGSGLAPTAPFPSPTVCRGCARDTSGESSVTAGCALSSASPSTWAARRLARRAAPRARRRALRASSGERTVSATPAAPGGRGGTPHSGGSAQRCFAVRRHQRPAERRPPDGSVAAKWWRSGSRSSSSRSVGPRTWARRADDEPTRTDERRRR